MGVWATSEMMDKVASKDCNCPRLPHYGASPVSVTSMLPVQQLVNYHLLFIAKYSYIPRWSTLLLQLPLK